MFYAQKKIKESWKGNLSELGTVFIGENKQE